MTASTESDSSALGKRSRRECRREAFQLLFRLRRVFYIIYIFHYLTRARLLRPFGARGNTTRRQLCLPFPLQVKGLYSSFSPAPQEVPGD